MRSMRAVPFVVVGALLAIGCSRPPADTTKTTTESTTKQVGSTEESKVVTTVATSEGDTTAVVNSYLGTVTVFEPGKRIEVMTGNKEVHSFLLEGKYEMISIESVTAVGSKVRLVESKGPQGQRQLTVTIAQSSE